MSSYFQRGVFDARRRRGQRHGLNWIIFAYFIHSSRYMRRDQLLPPEIGFKSDIVNALNDNVAIAPYPEMSEPEATTNSPAYPNKASKNSSETAHSYKSDDGVDSISSDIDNSDSSEFCKEAPRVENPKHISTPTNVAAESGNRDFFSQKVIEVKQPRPQRPLRGARMQFNRHGLPYPTEAYAKIEGRPCDHSGGDHRARH